MDNSVVPIPPVDSCAAGYQFYQCSDGGFSGCCSIDPCGIKVCPVESSPSSRSQTATIPSTTSAESSISTSMTVPALTFGSSTYLAPLTATVTASSLSGTSSPSGPFSSAHPSSSGRVNTSGAIIGGVVGGVLVLITLITAILFWSRIRKRSRTLNHDHEKWANDEASSNGRGYGDSIFDSYLSNGNNDAVVGLDGPKKYEKLTPMSDTNTNSIPTNLTQPSPCIFAGPRIVESTSGSTKYFHIPSSSSPRFFKYVDSSNPSASSLHKSCSAQTEISDSSGQISIGGVPVPRSTRSVSGR